MGFIELLKSDIAYFSKAFIKFSYIIASISLLEIVVMYCLDPEFDGHGLGFFGLFVVKGLNKVFRKKVKWEK